MTTLRFTGYAFRDTNGRVQDFRKITVTAVTTDKQSFVYKILRTDGGVSEIGLTKATGAIYRYTIDGVTLTGGTPLFATLTYKGKTSTIFGFNDANGETVLIHAGGAALPRFTTLASFRDFVENAKYARPAGDFAPGKTIELSDLAALTGRTENDVLTMTDSDRNVKIVTGQGNDNVTGNGAGNRFELGSGNDTGNGGGGSDSIVGNSGNDSLSGGTGNDTLNGASDNDLLNGGAGNDSLLAGGGNDTVYGGADNDYVSGSLGNDLIYGDSGNDRLHAIDGTDTIYGGDGADSLTGGSGNAQIFGDAGSDTLFGQDGNDTLFGGADNDSVYGDNGDDSLLGEDGVDRLAGGAGNDTLSGGDGADRIIGGGGNDRLFGGAGSDRFEFNAVTDGATNAVIEDWDGTDRIRLTLAAGTEFTSTQVGNHVQIDVGLGFRITVLDSTTSEVNFNIGTIFV